MAAREIVILAQPAANPRAGTITAPFQFLVDGADNLRVEGWNSAPGVVLDLTFRFAQPDGTIQVQGYTLHLTANRQSATLDLALGPGYLLNMAVFASGGTPKVGETFVCIKLIRGFGGATIVMGLLLQGYVTAEQGLGWPGSPITDSISSAGVMRGVVGTLPAPGVDFAETVPAGARWELLHLASTLVTSAVAGPRGARLYLTEGGVTTFTGPTNLFPIASQNTQFLWGQNLPLFSALIGATRFSQQPLPQYSILEAGDTLRSNTAGLDAADQWGAPVYLVREWLGVT